jgi:hypothetical protein
MGEASSCIYPCLTVSNGFQQHPEKHWLFLYSFALDSRFGRLAESICWFFIEGKVFFRLRRMSTPETNDLKQ